MGPLTASRHFTCGSFPAVNAVLEGTFGFIGTPEGMSADLRDEPPAVESSESGLPPGDIVKPRVWENVQGKSNGSLPPQTVNPSNDG